ncbi:MAG: anhydro-N-acetylmuramic acid kinase [Sinobacterium sp.]|nr:anhydro-N-acetylmuramic acid kinase [Sinobacterium sp.]
MNKHAYKAPEANLYIGIMSGTSIDGIDAVLVDFSEGRPHLVETLQGEFPSKMQAEIAALNHVCDNDLDRSMRLHRELGHLFADTVNTLLANAGVDPSEVVAIGSHGQTLRHQPDGPLGFTLQVGDAPTIAEQCGITVCANFRCRDIAAGGQGAPLVPAFHAKYLASPDRYRAVVNIGGMANITLLEPGKPIIGFDSGPGNVLMNDWAVKHLKQPYDDEGSWAATGVVNTKILDEMLAEDYFKQPAPKSTGREMFDWHFFEIFRHQDSPENIQATLLELTARSICDGLPEGVQDVYVCGGGASNTQLMKRIAELTAIQVQTTDDIGLPADWLEAIAFAWLARALMLGEPANEPHVTGAKHKRMLGAIYPA